MMEQDFRAGAGRAAMVAIRRILIEDWDPIGVRAVAQARDEYDGHAARVFGALAAGVAELRSLLEHISVSEIGLPACSGNAQGAAERIAALARAGGAASRP